MFFYKELCQRQEYDHMISKLERLNLSKLSMKWVLILCLKGSVEEFVECYEQGLEETGSEQLSILGYRRILLKRTRSVFELKRQLMNAFINSQSSKFRSVLENIFLEPVSDSLLKRLYKMIGHLLDKLNDLIDMHNKNKEHRLSRVLTELEHLVEMELVFG